MAEQSKLTLIERAFRLSPFSPPWTGFLFAVFSIALLTLLEIVGGRMDNIFYPDNLEREGFLFVVLHLMLLAYAPTAFVVLARDARRNAHALTRLVEPSEAVRDMLGRVGTYSARGLILSGIVGASIAIIAPFGDVLVWRDQLFSPYDFAIFTPELWAQRVIAPIFGFYAGVLPCAAIEEGWRFNRLARHVTNEHVLDRSCLIPFTRQGLSNVLIVAGFPAILSLFLFQTGLIYLVMGIGIVALAFAIGGLILPLRGIHDRVRAAKREQLVWVNAQMAVEQQSLKGGDGKRFANLMAYRTYVDMVREWPLDGSTISRLALYLAIPIFSWSGAAMVERMIDAALG